MEFHSSVSGVLLPNLFVARLDSSENFGQAFGMTYYSSADWATLGQAVQEARKEKGLGKTRDWANTVGRSERTLLELERGGKVGTATLEDVEDALGWPRAGAYRVLGGLPWRKLNSHAEAGATQGNELAEAIARIEKRLTAIEEQIGKAGTGDVANAAQKTGGGGEGLKLVASNHDDDGKPVSSEDGESLDPAALETEQGLDEEPGGSDHD